jgi:hypothetical protein
MPLDDTRRAAHGGAHEAFFNGATRSPLLKTANEFCSIDSTARA